MSDRAVLQQIQSLVNAALAVEPAVVKPPNPFVQWKADGFNLVQIMMWKLYRALTPAELVQAREAGYEVHDAPPPVPDNSTGDAWIDRRWKVGDMAAGETKAISISTPACTIEFGPSVSPPGAAKVFWDGVEVIAGRSIENGEGTHTLSAIADHACSLSVDLWHTP